MVASYDAGMVAIFEVEKIADAVSVVVDVLMVMEDADPIVDVRVPLVIPTPEAVVTPVFETVVVKYVPFLPPVEYGAATKPPTTPPLFQPNADGLPFETAEFG